MAVSIDDPPPTATIASNGPASRPNATARSSDSSVGSTRASSYVVTSRPAAVIASATRAGCPVAATPGSVTSSTRRAPNAARSWPTSADAPAPNFSAGAAYVKTVSLMAAT